jgi:hypothetical protein
MRERYTSEWEKCGQVWPTISLLLVIWASVGCVSNSARSRPSNIPVTAVWVGGSDGGTFIDCAPPRNGHNECVVYFENGEVYMKGRYILEGTGRAATGRELQYNAADGCRILLSNGLILIPVSPSESCKETVKP